MHGAGGIEHAWAMQTIKKRAYYMLSSVATLINHDVYLSMYDAYHGNLKIYSSEETRDCNFL